MTLAKLASNSVDSSKIVDASVVDADVSATAAIAGTKINPNFGSQNVTTTGQIRATQICTSGGTGCVTLPLTATTIDGGGTANFVTRFTDADTLGTGSIFDNLTNVGIGITTGLTEKLNVAGNISLENNSLLNTRALQFKDFDDASGGADNTYHRRR